jgi:asparagine synthase (glutamine-hydrolysing)
MCGICGFTGRANNILLKKMTDSIIHRGPDENGFHSDGNINLGIRRLSIIDVETGHQPIHNEKKNIWTVVNGEIYNYKELRKELKEKGHKFYTDHSDTEVIVHLYEEHGSDFIHKLNGMFAIALWDKVEDKLILIRDRMGVKPLFYTIVNNILIFGSEIKAILSHPCYDREVNYEAVYHYFTFKNIPAPMTAFKGIYSLTPGGMLNYSNGRVSTEKWWKIKFDVNKEYDDYYVTERIFTLLEDSVKLRMRSDVPFGAYLSGGVDSSAVVALMARFSDKPIKTFSLGYEDEFENKEADLYYARKVSKAYKTEHHEYIMSHNELIDEMDNVIDAFDQPFSGTISTYFLSKLIKNHVKVALSGDGADELFGSYLSHRAAQPMYHFNRLYDKVKSNSLTNTEKQLFAPCDIDFLNDLYKKSNGDEIKWRYNLYNYNDKEKESLLSDHFKSSMSSVSSFSVVKDNFSRLTSRAPLNRILEMEWNTQLPDQVLAFVDFLSMAHSVEVRSPFLDYRLVEFVATIPSHMKINNGNVKDILKKAIEPLLSKEIIKRPKEGFVLPVFDWMAEELKDYSSDVLSEDRVNRHNLLNSDAINDLLHNYYSGNKKDVGKVWNLMMFQLWWEKFFG